MHLMRKQVFLQNLYLYLQAVCWFVSVGLMYTLHNPLYFLLWQDLVPVSFDRIVEVFVLFRYRIHLLLHLNILAIMPQNLIDPY